MSRTWNFTGDNHESNLEAGKGRGFVGIDRPHQGGWREIQEDQFNSSSGGRGYESYAPSASLYSMAQPVRSTPGQYLPSSMRSNQTLSNNARPRVRSQRFTETLSSNRVHKRHIPRSTKIEVKHHKNALSQPQLQMPRLPPPTIVVQPASPTPVLGRRRSNPVFRGSQTGPGSSSSQHRSSSSTRHGDPKGAQKFALGRIDRSGPFTRRGKSENEESKQKNLMEAQGEDMQGLEMGLNRLKM
ncbi:hypothetical protein BOTCAL_0302g00070 [Botryotinia calthae]|uniref:Uncharacterized protein n=1 Tax=Botryotinia calthae TaxID=38488 RepID=A0A4Y8CUX4_9HELO|nr:hypothetical protein BOTCAL_0302g00070 [Botryotinia calthae]